MKKDWYELLRRYWVLGLVIAIFLLLKFRLPFLLDDDANLYWYIGKLVSGGLIPYRDFRIGHPPLMFLFSGFLFRIFGASLLVGRMVPALGGIGIIILTYLIGEKMKKGLGNMAVVLLFFSAHFQLLTNSMLGASLNLFFLLASFYLLLDERDFWVGICFVIAALARYSSFPFFLVILGYVIWKKRWKFFYGVGAMVPVLIGIFMIPNFFEYTILNMAGRNVLQSPKMTGFLTFLIVQKWMVLLGVVGGFLVFFKKGKKKVDDELLRIGVVVCASIVLVLLLSETRHWYLFYSIPFFCILGAYFLRYLRNRFSGVKEWAILLVLGLILFASFGSVLEYRDSTVAEEFLAPRVKPGMGVYDLSGTRAAYIAMRYRTTIPPELVDNNAIALASGIVNPGEVVGVLEEVMPAYLIDYRQDERTTYWMGTEIGGFVENNYVPVLEATEENTGNSLVIWERR